MPDFVISEFGGINTRKEDPANGVNLPTKIASPFAQTGRSKTE